MSDEETRAQEILAPFKKRINQTPALLSLLYDANMLPEQIVTVRGAISVAAVVAAYDAGATARIEALEAQLAQASAALEAADNLLRAVDFLADNDPYDVVCDGGGTAILVGLSGIRSGIAAYRKARGQDAD